MRRAPAPTRAICTAPRTAMRPVQAVRLPARRGYATDAPSNLKYTKSHEWIKVDGASATVGITDYAQKALGDVVFVDLPQVGKKLTAGGSFGAVESVKAASDVYSPIGGEVSEGWMIRLKNLNTKDIDRLLDSKAYTKEVENAKH